MAWGWLTMLTRLQCRPRRTQAVGRPRCNNICRRWWSPRMKCYPGARAEGKSLPAGRWHDARPQRCRRWGHTGPLLSTVGWSIQSIRQTLWHRPASRRQRPRTCPPIPSWSKRYSIYPGTAPLRCCWRWWWGIDRRHRWRCSCKSCPPASPTILPLKSQSLSQWSSSPAKISTVNSSHPPFIRSLDLNFKLCDRHSCPDECHHLQIATDGSWLQISIRTVQYSRRESRQNGKISMAQSWDMERWLRDDTRAFDPETRPFAFDRLGYNYRRNLNVRSIISCDWLRAQLTFVRELYQLKFPRKLGQR